MGFFDRFRKKKTKDKEAKPAPKPAAPAGASAGGYPADSPPAEYVPNLGAPEGGKIKLAIYWAAGCGGCDVSLLDTDEKILNIGDMAEIVMWPIAHDGKEKDIEAMEDGSITVAILNGAIRNSENEHMAKLLRKKAKLVVSYGTCACFGGSPALANLVPGGHKEIMDYVYKELPTSANFQKECGHENDPVVPQTSWQAPEGELTLPVLYDTVKTVDQVIDVDYYIPGCPPTQKSITQLLNALVDFVYKGEPLPPKGTMVGVVNKTLCEECHRTKENRRLTKIYEPHEVDVDPQLCLMDQGILCLGPATLAGCGAPCTAAGQPCRGCYGPSEVVDELGASMFTAVASLFPVLDEDPVCGEDDIIKIMESVKDPLGYFYAFTMSKSLIKRSVVEGGQ